MFFKIGDLETAALKYFESGDEEYEEQYFIDCSEVIRHFVSSYYQSEYIFSTFTYLKEVDKGGIFPKTFYNYGEKEQLIKPYINLLVNKMIPQKVSVNFTDILTKNKNLGLLLHNKNIHLNYDDIELTCNLNDFQITGNELLDEVLHQEEINFVEVFSKISFDPETLKMFINKYASTQHNNNSRFFSILAIYHRIATVVDGNLFFYFLRPTVVHEEFNGIYSICLSRALSDMELKKIQLLIYRVYSKVAIKKLQHSKGKVIQANIQNSITNILSRNFSHNIGSHVMHNADMEHITAKLNPQQGSATLSVAAELNAHRYAAALKSLLDRYIVQRNEYLADVSESTMPAGNYARFYSEVVMPFVENFLLTDNIAAAEGIGFPKYGSNNRLQIRVFVEGKELITLYNGSNTEGGIQYGYPNIAEVQYDGKPLSLPYYISLKKKKKQFQEIGHTKLNLIQTDSSDSLDAFFNSKRIIGLTNEAEGIADTYEADNSDVEIALPGVLGKHAFYSLLENFIRNNAKHNKKGLKDRDLVVKIELTKLDKEDIDHKRFMTEHDAWKITISDDNRSWITDEEFKTLENFVNKQLIEGQTGAPRKTGLGIADMVVSASILAGSFDFDFTKEKNRYLKIKKVKTEGEKSTFAYSFYLLKAKRIICLTNSRNDQTQHQSVWREAGISFVTNVADMYNQMGRKRQSYRFAVLDADLLDNDLGNDIEKYEALLANLPFRVIIKEDPKKDYTGKPWRTLAQQRRVVIYKGIIQNESPEEFQRFCWEQWLLLFFSRVQNRLPLQLHLYLEHENSTWRNMPKSYGNLIELNVYTSQNDEFKYKDASAVNIVYDHHCQLLEKFDDRADLLERDSYNIFDKNSADFSRLIYPDTNTSKTLPYMMVEAGLMRILVMDERVTERSQLNAFSDSEGRFLGNADPKFLKYTEQGEDVKDSIFELAWASGVHIATHYQINDGEQYPLSNRPPSNEHARHLTLRILTDSQDGKYGKIQVISNLQRANGTMYQVTDNHYDMILIHRTVLKQIQDTIKDSKVEFNFLRDIKDTIPFAVVDSGGGYPNEIREEFKSRFKFLPFSFMSEHLLRDRIAKVGLSQLLMGLTDAQQND